MNHHHPQNIKGPHVAACLTEGTEVAHPHPVNGLVQAKTPPHHAGATQLPRQRVRGLQAVAGISEQAAMGCGLGPFAKPTALTSRVGALLAWLPRAPGVCPPVVASGVSPRGSQRCVLRATCAWSRPAALLLPCQGAPAPGYAGKGFVKRKRLWQFGAYPPQSPPGRNYQPPAACARGPTHTWAKRLADGMRSVGKQCVPAAAPLQQTALHSIYFRVSEIRLWLTWECVMQQRKRLKSHFSKHQTF